MIYIIESIFFNGNTWTDLNNLNHHSLSKQFFPSNFYLPNQSSGGQKRWPSQMGAATLTQLYPANILTSYLTALATQRWELRIKTFKKILQNTIANWISNFFTVEEFGLRWFCWQQWRSLSEGHERAHWSKSLCKSIVIVNRFNDHNKNQIYIANG